MQIIGLCRFSYPAIGGFQVEHDSHAERIAYLWAEPRLEERFRLFESVALPCLRAQTEPEYDLLILIGEDFPKPHHDRLHDLVADMPQIRIVAEPPRRNREVCKALLNSARRNPDAPCLQFRLDDDDAMAVDLMEKARAAVRACRPLTRAHRTVGLNWPSGYIARFGAEGVAAAELVQPYNTAGLMIHVAGGCQQTIYNFMHKRIPTFMPCISLPDAAMYVRSHNGFNDSRQKKVKPVELAPLDAAQVKLFRDRFALDVYAVKRVFSAPQQVPLSPESEKPRRYHNPRAQQGQPIRPVAKDHEAQN